MVKVIPQDRVSERTVDQIVHVLGTPWSSNTSHSLEHETDEVSEKSDVTKSSFDVDESPCVWVCGLITDLTPYEDLFGVHELKLC